MRILVVSNHWAETKTIPYSGIFVDRQVTSLKEAGVEIGTFDINSSHSPLHLFRKWRELRREVRRFKPHLVHARYGTIVATLSVFSGCPAVITFCGSDLLPGASVSLVRTYLGIFLSNFAALFARAIICVSEELRQALWWRRDRAVVIPDGVDLDLFMPGSREAARQVLDWDLNRSIVLINARRDPRNKGLELAQAAIKVAKSRVPNVELKVVECVAPGEMPLYYHAADVLLCASRQEGSPNVVKEALACNLPVVSSPVGDVPERLANVQPAKIVQRDPKLMGEALAEILRLRTRCNGREHVAHLDLKRTAQKVLTVYHAALNFNRHSTIAIPFSTGVSIVPMTPAMVPDVAKIHSEAFAGYLSARLGRTYVKAYIRWFCQAGQAIALVATDGDHKIIGYVVGAPLGYNQAMSRSLFLVAATSIMLRPWLFFSAPFRRAVVARLWLMLGLSSPQPAEISLPPPAMSLVTIGVSSGARGKNVGRSLTEAFEAKARARQMRSLRLSVLPDNISARRLYEKCGWQPLATPVRDHEAMYYFRVLTN